jgi:predicted double-glycine peptidase
MVDLRFKRVVRQNFDLSCGAAAVATLLTYFYGDRVGEKAIIDEIFKFGDKKKIQKDGFSMLELKKYGDARGYVVRGFKVKDLASLSKLKIPVLSLINVRGYNHFVVIKGIKGGQVFVADPAFGNRNWPLESFGAKWSRVILVFLSRDKSPKNQLALKPALRAPLSQVMYSIDRYLGRIRPGGSEF